MPPSLPLGLLLVGLGADPAVLSTVVEGSQHLVAGTPAALRVATERSTSPDARAPWEGVKVSLELEGKGLRQALGEGVSGPNGEAALHFSAPSWPQGTYQLVVSSLAPGAAQPLVERFDVDLAPSGKLLLQSDKPLYQPGQLVHLKTLVLRSLDQRPLAGAEVSFEVSDPRGNKVFSSTVKSSAFGIAATDFELGPDGLLGAWKAAASVKGNEVPAQEIELKVERYRLPRFRVSLEPDRGWYRFGDEAVVRLESEYVFGKPVANAEVTAVLGAGGELTATVQRLTARTGPDGHTTLRFKLPNAATAPRAPLSLAVEVRDASGHSERAAHPIIVATLGVDGEVVPEFPVLAAGLKSRIWVLAAAPDGAPLEGATVTLRAPTARTHEQTAKTGPLGVAELSLVVSSEFGKCGQLQLEVSHHGESWKDERCVPIEQDAIRLRTDRAFYPEGAPITVELNATRPVDGVARLSMLKEDQMLDVTPLEVKGGHGSVVLPPDDRRFGLLKVQASWAGQAQSQSDARLIYVERPRGLTVQASAAGAHPDGTFRPGEVAHLSLKVVDAQSGVPVRAALGLVMIDSAILALRPLRPSMSRAWFNLSQAATAHPWTPRLKPGGQTLAGLLEHPPAAPDADLAANVLLAGARPPWNVPLRSDGFVELVRLRDEREQRIVEALDGYQHGHQLGEKVPGTVAGWRYRRGLVEQMVADGAVKPRDGRDPWGHAFDVDKVTHELGELDEWAQTAASERLTRIYGLLAAEQKAGRLKLDGAKDKPVATIEQADLDRLIAEGKLTGAWAVDPWGAPWRISRRPKVLWIAGVRSRDVVASAGPDGVPGDADDRYPGDDSFTQPGLVQAVIGEPAGYGTRGFATGGYGSGVGVLGGKLAVDVGISVSQPYAMGSGARTRARTRDRFPETLLWESELDTDEKGEARRDVELADSITTWRLGIDAVSEDGRLGHATLDVRTFQDFFADVDLPPVLTQHDEITAPVTVFNYLKTAQAVTVTLETLDGFEAMGPKSQSLQLAPGAVGAAQFRLRAVSAGTHSVSVRATGSHGEDAIRREVEVAPDGVERVLSFQGNAGQQERNHTIEIPTSVIDGTPHTTLKLFPGLGAQAVNGLEGMLQMPSGCFEQASSTTYPNALILDYLRKTHRSTPELEAKTRRLLSLGYQKLLSYEVKGGGFSWFGDAPANRVLTAYGLEEFSDMARVFPVDPRVIERTRDWLVRGQQDDGSWPNQPSPIHDGATDRFDNDRVRTTAYLALALQRAGGAHAAVARASRYVAAHLGPDADAYTLALVAELYSAIGADPSAVRERLWKTGEIGDKSVRFVEAHGGTLTHSTGRAATVETSARAALALMAAHSPADRTQRAVAFLTTEKDATGAWYSTQATIRALQALLTYEAQRSQKPGGRLVVTVDGAPAGAIEVKPAEDVVQSLELKGVDSPGRHSVTLSMEGKGEVGYQLVERHFLPHPKEVDQEEPALSVRTMFEDVEAKVGDQLEETVVVRSDEAVPMPVVRAGVPPGFQVDENALEDLVIQKTIDRYERGPREIVFYLSKLPAHRQLWLPISLTARTRSKVQVPPAVLYEYYRPENHAEGQPVTLTVR